VLLIITGNPATCECSWISLLLLSSNMYEDQKKLISPLFQSRLLLQGTLWQRQHHSPFILHHHAGQTASLPVKGMR